MALNDFKDTNQGGGVLTVSNSNIGKGIKWNPDTKQYEVDVKEDSGIIINELGELEVRVSELEDNANETGVVKHRRAIIDYGGLIEVSGTITLGLMSPAFAYSVNVSTAAITEEINRLKSIYGQGFFAYRPNKVTSTPMGNVPDVLYYVESEYKIDVAEFGISKVISVSCTAGDITGPRKETAWVVNDITTPTTVVPIGIHVYYSEGQTECAVSYTIKGIKA